MLNPLAALKAYMALAKVKTDLKAGPKPGVYSTEFWVLLFTSAVVLNEGLKGVIPAEYSVGIAAGLAVLYVAARFVLKLKGKELPAIAGIAELNEKQLEEIRRILEAANVATQKPVGPQAV